jgi:mycofactocin precursor
MSQHVALAERAADAADVTAAAQEQGSGPAAAPVAVAEPVVMIQDLLVEEVSIDGMCGVY